MLCCGWCCLCCCCRYAEPGATVLRADHRQGCYAAEGRQCLADCSFVSAVSCRLRQRVDAVRNVLSVARSLSLAHRADTALWMRSTCGTCRLLSYSFTGSLHSFVCWASVRVWVNVCLRVCVCSLFTLSMPHMPGRFCGLLFDTILLFCCCCFRVFFFIVLHFGFLALTCNKMELICGQTVCILFDCTVTAVARL